MDVFVRLGSRRNRTLSGPIRDDILAMVKVKLGTLLAAKGFKTSRNPQEGPPPLERIVTLLGEGFPVMLRDSESL